MTAQARGRIPVWSRRDAVRLLGLGGAGLAAGCGRAPESDPVAESPSAAESPPPGGAIVRTILEDLAPEELSHGAVLFHEHMSLDIPFWDRLVGADNPARDSFIGAPDTPYFMQDVEAMTGELQAAARDGVAALVDGGHADMGRDVSFLRTVSERSGMPIVASGGYYTDPFHPPELADLTDDEIAASLAETAAAQRWGAFGEIASSAEMTPGERKVFHAIGKAHLLTNLPIFTHTANGLEAEAQLDIFDSLDVPPGSVAIGHMGGLDDPEATVHRRLAERGAFVGFDRLGSGPEADGRKVPMIRALIDAGHLENLLLASDFARASDIQRNGGPGYAKTVTQFLPLLREAGVSEEQIRIMTVDNPLRLLAFVPRSA
jgi:phosphotriesterase-related protein